MKLNRVKEVSGDLRWYKKGFTKWAHRGGEKKDAEGKKRLLQMLGKENKDNRKENKITSQKEHVGGKGKVK